jgi:hypothetical protein
MDCSPQETIGRRLATQQLTTAPFDDPADVVRSLLCVQAQDAPLARYSLGLRSKANDDASVRAALRAGHVLRTHILRPTWHFVAADDLRWILALTSPKVESSLASRHRNVGVDDDMIERVHGKFVSMLSGHRCLTAPEIIERLTEEGLSLRNEAVRHLLLVAEIRGLVCSGPLQDTTHTYGLVDELVPPAAPLERDDAIRRFVRRYFSGHGPASEQDLRHWTTLTLAEIRSAVADLGDALEAVTCDGVTLWFDPTSSRHGPAGGSGAGSKRRRVALLSTFDEAYLPYRSVAVPRTPGHPRGEEPHVFAEAGGGVVLADGCDAGWWKRTVRSKTTMAIRLCLAGGLNDEQRALIDDEATHLAAFFGRSAAVEIVDP